jgi:hypothetical protein
MKIKLIYEKRYLKLILVFLFIMIFLSFLVLGISYSAHTGANIEVSIGSENKNLQEAIDDGDFNGLDGLHGANQEGESCVFCQSCGGDYPKEEGFIGHKSWGRPNNCNGNSIAEKNFVSLCCK